MNDEDFEQPWSFSLPLNSMSRMEGFEPRDLDRESEFPQDNHREKKGGRRHAKNSYQKDLVFQDLCSLVAEMSAF